jgi:RNA polymerase sigma-70 factor (ECF subfamily)
LGASDTPPGAEVLIEHTAFLTRLARSLLRDEDAAEDVVQETFERAITKPPRPGNLPGWLARVARNLALSRLRSERRRRGREEAVARSAELPPVDEAVARLELQRNAVAAVLELPEPYRSTLVHRFLDDIPAARIAERAGLPVDTVRTRLRRGLGMVRARLDAEHAGDRRAWSMLLLPLLVRKSGAASFVTGGMLIVSTKLKIAVAVPTEVAGPLTLEILPRGDRADPSNRGLHAVRISGVEPGSTGLRVSLERR